MRFTQADGALAAKEDGSRASSGSHPDVVRTPFRLHGAQTRTGARRNLGNLARQAVSRTRSYQTSVLTALSTN